MLWHSRTTVLLDRRIRHLGPASGRQASRRHDPTGNDRRNGRSGNLQERTRGGDRAALSRRLRAILPTENGLRRRRSPRPSSAGSPVIGDAAHAALEAIVGNWIAILIGEDLAVLADLVELTVRTLDNLARFLLGSESRIEVGIVLLILERLVFRRKESELDNLLARTHGHVVARNKIPVLSLTAGGSHAETLTDRPLYSSRLVGRTMLTSLDPRL